MPIDRIDEDLDNPRTEFPDADIDELAEDIRQHGVLQPIVVRALATTGRYCIRLGAKRLRAAKRAGLSVVPVTIGTQKIDAFAQVAENQKRHGLTPLDLARFIRGRVDAGESNADVARRLGMNLTTVAHHLTLPELPPVLEDALQSGRCTSPRTLHELSKLHADNPDQIQDLLTSGTELTRTAVSALRAATEDGTAPNANPSPPSTLIAQANSACDRLERALGRIRSSTADTVALPELLVGELALPHDMLLALLGLQSCRSSLLLNGSRSWDRVRLIGL